jgi:hypothetical protein
LGKDWTADERTALYNEILKIRTLQGIEYFSSTRNRMRVLYDISEVIDGPDSRTPQADPSYQIPPAELTLYTRQKDSTFGDNVYRYTYYYHDASYIIYQENVTDMYFGFIRVIPKHKLRSFVVVIDSGPYLLIYSASMAKVSLLPGMKQQAASSIYNRMEAITNWFIQKADLVFEKRKQLSFQENYLSFREE